MISIYYLYGYTSVVWKNNGMWSIKDVPKDNVERLHQPSRQRHKNFDPNGISVISRKVGKHMKNADLHEIVYRVPFKEVTPSASRFGLWAVLNRTMSHNPLRTDVRSTTHEYPTSFTELHPRFAFQGYCWTWFGPSAVKKLPEQPVLCQCLERTWQEKMGDMVNIQR